MAEPPAQPAEVARCATHGLAYDPTRAQGCVICRREAGEVIGPPVTPSEAPRGVWTTGRAIGVVVVLVVVVGCIGSWAIGRRFLRRAATQAPGVASLTPLPPPPAVQLELSPITTSFLAGTWDEDSKPGDYFVFRTDSTATMVESASGAFPMRYALDSSRSPSSLDLIANGVTIFMLVERVDEDRLSVCANRTHRPVSMTDGRVTTLSRRR